MHRWFLLPGHRYVSVSYSTANYNLMLKNTFISMASGVIWIEPLWTVIGAERVKALPAFHALTGADNTGRFSCIGKAT